MNRSPLGTEIYELRKRAGNWSTLALLFWFIETTFFLILEGWHWTATNHLEIWSDRGVALFFLVAIYHYARAIDKIVKTHCH